MAKPTQDQLREFQRLRLNNQVVKYLNAMEKEYVDKLVGETNLATIHQLQGSIYVVRHLLSMIFSD